MLRLRSLLACALVIAASACAAEDGDDASRTDDALVQTGACVPAAVNAEYACRVARAADPGQHRLVTTVYEGFGVNVRGTPSAEVTHAKAGWVRFGFDPADRTPLDHLDTYGKRIADYHHRGIKVLFNVTEGLTPIPNRPDGPGGDYAKDSCASDPAIAKLWPKCGMSREAGAELDARWGIVAPGGKPAPATAYMPRFEAALTRLMMDLGANDDDARPDVWEILNEPDNANRDDGHPHGHQLNVHVTAAILRTARKVIDRANARFHPTGPKERLAFGALMMTSSWRLLEGSVILSSDDPSKPTPLFDLATYHVYVKAEQAGAIEEGSRPVAAAAHGKPLMITEFGFDTTGPGPGLAAIETFMKTAHALPSKGIPVESSFVFSWADGDSGSADHYGLVTRGGGCSHAKLALDAFATTAEAIARSIQHNEKCDAH